MSSRDTANLQTDWIAIQNDENMRIQVHNLPISLIEQTLTRLTSKNRFLWFINSERNNPFTDTELRKKNGFSKVLNRRYQ